MPKNIFEIERDYTDCPLNESCTVMIQCVFEKGGLTRTEEIETTLTGKTLKHTLTFDFLDTKSQDPFSFTVYASTVSLKGIVRFKEINKSLSFNTKSTLEITLGANNIHVNGWLTEIIDSELGLFESLPPNVAYNTMISIRNLVPVSIDNIEPEPKTDNLELKLTNGDYTLMRKYECSTNIQSEISVQSYLFNISNSDAKLQVRQQNTSERNMAIFDVNVNKSAEFELTLLKEKFSILRFC